MTCFSNQLSVMAAKSSKSDENKWLPFWMHSLDTAYIVKKLMRRWIPESVYRVAEAEGLSGPEFEKLMFFLGLVHDIGKLTTDFQSKIAENIADYREKVESNNIGIPNMNYARNKKAIKHSLAGESILVSEFNCPKAIAEIVGAHHGKPGDFLIFPEDLIEYYSRNFYGKEKEQWQSLWKEWLDFALKRSGYHSLDDLPVIEKRGFLVLATSILITADWIASNTDYFPLIELNDYYDVDIYPGRVNHAWKKLKFPDLWKPDELKIDSFFSSFGFEANDIQNAMLDCASENPGLIILEAQMGCGKTEAALAAVQNLAYFQGAGGMYFGLPTQATTNGIFPRLKNWAEKQSQAEKHTLELKHGSSALNELYQSMSNSQNSNTEDGEGLYIHPWFEGRKTGLLADFVVATVDQFLMAALKRKHFMLRFLGLIGKVVVIDECHAYDTYMNQYLDTVLNWLGYYQTPVILLSATLPSERKKDMIQAYLKGKDRKAWKEIPELEKAYPQITYTVGTQVKQKLVEQNHEKKTVHIEKICEDDIQTVLADRLSSGGCAGIIVNTVNVAQKLYDSLQKRLPDYEIILFHSRFTMADRAKIEEEVLRRIGKNSDIKNRDKVIIIGTQVLEQSLDIDFDIMFTQLCPMDLLLQRIGRLQRHERKRPELLSKAFCYIVHPKEALYDKGSSYIYTDWLLTQTEKHLKDVFCLPNDISLLVEKVYEKPDMYKLNDAEIEYYECFIKEKDDKRKRANHFRITKVNGRFMTGLLDSKDALSNVRDGDDSIEAILLIKSNDKQIALLPWQSEGRQLSREEVPSYEEALIIQRQKIKLPNSFSKFHWEETNKALKNNEIEAWNDNSILKGESYVLLDADRTTEIAGYRINYDQKKGLIYDKIGDAIDEK